LRIIVALLGPIFAKEFLKAARSRRYHIARVLYGGTLLLSLAIVWNIYNVRLAGRFRSLKEMAQMADGLFHAISAVQYGAVIVFVPLFLCGSVAGEREEKTLDALFLTQLKDREIVWGKLASRILGLVLLLVGSVPFLSVLPLFGGVPPAAFGLIFAATLLTLVFSAAVSVYFSVTSRTYRTALFRTYFCLGFWLLVVPALVIAGGISSSAKLLAFMNPSGAFLAAYDGSVYALFSTAFSPWFFPLLFIFPVTWSLYVVQRATARLHAQPRTLSQRLPRIEILRPLLHWLGEAIRLERSLLREDLPPTRPVANPLWQRARRWRVFDPRGQLGYLQWASWPIAIVFFVVLMYFSQSSWDRRSAGLFLGSTWLAVGALTAILAASSPVAERRSGFLDLILLTLLTPAEIVDGAALVLWQHLRRLYYVLLAFGLVFTLTGSPDLESFLYSAITATFFCVLLFYQGLACSLTARSQTSALIPTIALPLTVIVGLPLLGNLPWKYFDTVLGAGIILSAVASAMWVRWRPTPSAIGCHFVAMHLVFTALAIFCVWHTWRPPVAESVFQIMNPLRLIVDPIRRPPGYWVANQLYPGEMCLAYGFALAVNIAWARNWLVRHFNLLVGRVSDRTTLRSHTGGSAPRIPFPGKVDLIPEFQAFGLAPEVQGERDDCSLFVITALAEFEWAKHGPRPHCSFSQEFLIWAANEASGSTRDQTMFYKAAHGLNSLGICNQELMPYLKRRDPRRRPSTAAQADAKGRSGRWQVEWIRRWDVKRPVSHQELLAIKEALAAGHPVACGLRWPKSLKGFELLEVPPLDRLAQGHSIVFTGYQEGLKGGEGVFSFRNSWGTGWGNDGYGVMSYAYAQAHANDIVWLQLGPPHSEVPAERFEAESLPVSARVRCQTKVQDMGQWGGGMWSSGNQLLCLAQLGGFLELSFPVAKTGRYRVRALATAAPDFGKIRAMLDGKPLAPEFDLYCGRVSPSGSLELGTHKLATGHHRLRFIAVGKNPDSTDYYFGIDAIDLLLPTGKE
jgi:ABC-type transport system involved in multi-copper enzyme maturation permease subunit